MFLFVFGWFGGSECVDGQKQPSRQSSCIPLLSQLDLLQAPMGFLGDLLVKNLDTRVQFLGQEHPLEKEMATHSNILAWEIPWKSLIAFSYSFPIPHT